MDPYLKPFAMTWRLHSSFHPPTDDGNRSKDFACGPKSGACETAAVWLVKPEH
jgi:hypothetical protein